MNEITSTIKLNVSHGAVAVSLSRNLAFGQTGYGVLQNQLTAVGSWGEIFTVTAVADSSGSLNNKYFLFTVGTTNYYAWFNVSSGGSDPSLAGKTGIAVAIATNDTADTVAAALQSAVSTALSTAATVTVSTDTVTASLTAHSNVTDAVDFNTGFTIAVTRQGSSATETQINLGGNSPGLVFIQNLDSTNYIDVSDNTSTYPTQLRVLPGQFIIVNWSASTSAIYVRANTNFVPFYYTIITA